MDRTASDAKAIFIAALDREPGAERARTWSSRAAIGSS